MRDELLEESFPKIHPEEDKAKELTMDEFVALRTGLQEVIQSDVQEKMILLQDQLHEYHSVLEDLIASKSRCERLEQEKKDLATAYHQACQVRDDKIALLEKELARLRNERHSSSSISSCSSSDGASSLIGMQAPALTSRTPKMSDHHHHYYKVAARMICLSPASVPYPRSSDSSDGLSVGAMQEPLPFQESSAPLFVGMNQQGGFDDSSSSSRSGENRSAKRHRPS